MADKVIVVDDDPLVGDLTMYLLRDAGYDPELIADSLKAISVIRERKPSLVLLDILMPGVDGLTLCHKIKTDPELKLIKVAICSGKSFQAEKDRALKYGADAFIEKPYHVDTFNAKIREILGTPEAAKTKLDTPAAGPALKVAIHGCRSQKTAGSAFGNHSPCVTVEAGDKLFVFDGGTGIAGASEVVAKGSHKKVWLFLSHFHANHLEGLSSLKCVSDPATTIFLSGANDPETTLQQAAQRAFTQTPIAAQFQLYELLEDSYEIAPGVKLTSFYANHPGTTLGFRLETGGKSFVYCADGEIYGESATALQDYDEKLSGLCKDADLLIHDAHFTIEDYNNHKNEGHTSFANAVAFAARAKVKEICLFHLNSAYDDAALEKLAQAAQTLGVEKGVKVTVAREGQSLLV
jgi:CheY-like chemotaxis protein